MHQKGPTATHTPTHTFSGSQDSVRLWDMHTYTQVAVLPVRGSVSSCHPMLLSFDPAGRFLASGKLSNVGHRLMVAMIIVMYSFQQDLKSVSRCGT